MLIFLIPAAMFVGTLALPIGMLITGWTVEARTQWIAPDIVSIDGRQIGDPSKVTTQ